MNLSRIKLRTDFQVFHYVAQMFHYLAQRSLEAFFYIIVEAWTLYAVIFKFRINILPCDHYILAPLCSAQCFLNEIINYPPLGPPGAGGSSNTALVAQAHSSK